MVEAAALRCARRRLSTHVATTVDGNGRCAGARQLKSATTLGQSAESVKSARETVLKVGTGYSTLGGSSSEDPFRSRFEISHLVGSSSDFPRREPNNLQEQGIKPCIIDKRRSLPSGRFRRVEMAEANAFGDPQRTLVMAPRHGGHAEIDKDLLNKDPFFVGNTAPDLLIPTRGEERIGSSFPSRMICCKPIFVEFRRPGCSSVDFAEALAECFRRERRDVVTRA